MCNTVAPDPLEKAVVGPFTLLRYLLFLVLLELELELELELCDKFYLFIIFELCRFRMSFARSHLMAQSAALQKEREEGDGDYTLTCQGKVLKAHSFILGMRWLLLSF